MNEIGQSQRTKGIERARTQPDAIQWWGGGAWSWRAVKRERGGRMVTTRRFVCIHGHFYQPPRENPWLETVETQGSAAPYHDWNERICAECYATNGASRIVNKQNQITRIVNNYSRISFNFGPTLLSWLAEKAPRAYRAILDGERRSRELFKGHSSAMAQVYNHIILPLASGRDRTTQIRWGIADYKSRYGIAPEGMWLAETAADNDSLERMAAEGIRFTVLAPHQCKRFRPIAYGHEAQTALSAGERPKSADPLRMPTEAIQPTSDWIETANASVNPTRPYLVRFPSGRSIAVFFYDGPTSRAVAFEGLLNSGEDFASRLKLGFLDDSQPQLAHIATDGESYGHHHKHGEMALSYALQLLEQEKGIGLANYASFLAEFPPQFEAEINENTSWSCSHGVERWRSNCGCNGGKTGWNQTWRGPLRAALDQLRDTITPLTEELGKKLFADVWEARDAYISVILDRSAENGSDFLAAHQSHVLTHEERVNALGLMEMQRHAQLMYTSCGWFFDDISGIETVQIIAYATRVLQLARALFGEDVANIETEFLEQLSQARSNVPSAGDGARIYRDQVLPMELTLEQVAAHYAISSVFSSFADDTELFCYRIHRLSHEMLISGKGRLAVGHVRVVSTITDHADEFTYAVLHFGDQNITAAVKAYRNTDEDIYRGMMVEVRGKVMEANFPEVIRLLDRYYDLDYSLTSLFRDEQQRITQIILNSTLRDIETSLTSIYENHASLLHFLSRTGLPKPPALTLAASFAVNVGLRRALEEDAVDGAEIRSLLAMAADDEVALDTPTLSYLADQRMKRAMVDLQMSSGSLDSIERTLVLARVLREMPFELNLWQAQNLWYEIFRSSEYSLTGHAREQRPEWEKNFHELGECLSIACDVITTDEPIAATPGD
uniref:Glycoside hydrolase, family 57 n=1 Tax=mine drainage metagenome TaxID=410659 RepID=E6QHG4_9ZZZZ